ncbi:putative Erythronate-4-phosphate dehydrogenase family protein [Hibiscus syriacus]|uniref:Erythronate-4-phosphate dehydrogenase family protein n=2 Tax=Hibiscus syriacus TaxID=106335 RepID=A0A6A2XMC6_HIBSY|nr:putative Erythronate-4-phosphate dehydrogenase family protein [Hibiscus syriacus]
MWGKTSTVKVSLAGPNLGLSYIVGALGIPLYIDTITASKEHLKFAKVCVEVKGGARFPRSIAIRMKDGIIEKAEEFGASVASDFHPLDLPSQKKKGHGKKRDKGKVAFVSSSNKFEVFGAVLDESDGAGRKIRLASQESHVEFQAPIEFDHFLVVVWHYGDSLTARPKPFKYFSFLEGYHGFKEVLRNYLRELVQGNPIVKLEEKHMENLVRSDSTSFAIENELQMELVDLEKVEMLFYQQKDKENWLQEGDQCTKFFHFQVTIKRKRSTIRFVMDEKGNSLETFDSMSSKMVRFFTNQIGVIDYVVQGYDVAFVKCLTGYSFPEEWRVDLTKEVSREKVKVSTSSQGKNKALGPNGFTTGFFQSSWDVVGDDVYAVVKNERGEARRSLSPYLFVLATNILLRLLDVAAGEKLFHYHPKYRKLKLPHMCFADDLFIFFYKEIFTLVMNDDMISLVHATTGFRVRRLPIRYLGVPLLPKKLTENDCATLVDRIKAMMGPWSSKLLSYAGRLQLVPMERGDVPVRGARMSWDSICTLNLRGSRIDCLLLIGLSEWGWWLMGVAGCGVMLEIRIDRAVGSWEDEHNWVVDFLKGIDSIAMDMKAKQLTVIGTVDPVNVMSKLSKYWPTDIVSVGPAKEPVKKEEPKKEEPPKKEKEPPKNEEPKKKEEPKKEKKKPVPPPDPVSELVKAYKAYNPHMTTYYFVQSMEENPNACVIC